MVTLFSLLLFLSASAAMVWLWNRFFEPVPWRIAAGFIAAVTVYQSTTLLTPRVDLPTRVFFNAYPWKALGVEPDSANTGIVVAQIAPWTEVAVKAIRSGEWPLWNRYSASGSLLLANQQTAIFHPFTLLSFLLLPTGKAFTLTASLRLFSCLLFTFLLLRRQKLSTAPAVFGAAAYTFSTFHIVWLLFPLGLATFMLPIALVGVQELAARPRMRSFLLLTAGLSLSVLGGHPESAFWVWAAAAAFAAFCCWRKGLSFVLAPTAFVSAAALTAIVWWPTVEQLPFLGRTVLMKSAVTNPVDHGLGREWLDLLIAPNVLGTPQTDFWTGPATSHPIVLHDYGEIASGYAGLITLALSFTAILTVRRKEVWFFAGVMLFALLTIAEVPGWRDALRIIPVAGLTLHQRLRILWILGVCVTAAHGLQALRDVHARIALTLMTLLLTLIYIDHAPEAAAAWFTFAATLVVSTIFFVYPRATVATVCVAAELALVTWRYNPSTPARFAKPATPAIDFMKQQSGIHRFVALGGSFAPDTPGSYGLQDVRSTDPVAHLRYMRLLNGFLHTTSTYDQIVGSVSEPFFDFLNIRYLYVPPDVHFSDARFAIRYAGTDGSVFENTTALPRYFLIRRYTVDASFDRAIPRLIAIRDFSHDAVVDHVPSKVAGRAPHFLPSQDQAWVGSGRGSVKVVEFRNNRTILDVTADAWALLATSDTHWAGWRAYVNGQREPPVTVNGAFVGVFVPPGQSRVEFRYRPAGFERGLRTTAAGALIIAIAAAVRWRSRRRA
jgi:hypothetical protein